MKTIKIDLPLILLPAHDMTNQCDDKKCIEFELKISSIARLSLVC